MLGEIGKLKHLPSTSTGIFKFMRDGYRTLELSCLSNRGGRFVEISEYHGGAQRGRLLVPEGRRGAGWLRFEDESELRPYFLAKIEPEVAAPVGIGKAPIMEMGLRTIRNDRNLNSKKESRDSRVRFDSVKFA